MKKEKFKLLLSVSIGLMHMLMTNLYASSIDKPSYLSVSLYFETQQMVSGTVLDDQNIPLPGASVVLMGTTKGVVADFDGKFSIEASKGDVLVVSYIGYETMQVSIQDQTDIIVKLNASSSQLEEVVVTALGIKKEKRRIGYAVQELGGESLQKAQTSNVMESLTGKISGLTISNSNEVFTSPKIYLRGSKPLVVIDGVPSPDTDFQNISSDDIESISVLKAASASALYGSQGLNGAVQITLKSGSNVDIGTSVFVNSSTSFQTDFLVIPRAQTEYGPGNAGVYQFGTGAAGGGGFNDFDYSIWGPKFDGRLIKQFDSPIDPNTGERIPTPWISRGPYNLKNYMETGVVSTNNVTVSTKGEKGNFTISNTYKYTKASEPGAKVDVNILRLRGLLNITDKLSAEGSLQHSYQFASNLPSAGYGPQSPIYTMSLWGGAHWDVRNFKDYWDPGQEGVKQRFVENWRYNNPYALAHALRKPYTKNDVLGFLKLNYKVNDQIALYIKTTLNTWNRTRDEEIEMDIYDYSIPDRGGRYRHSQDELVESNTDFLVSYNNSFFNKTFSLDATLGGNQRYYGYDYNYATTTQLVVPGVFKLSNSVDQVTPLSYKEKKGVYSAYANLDMAYKTQFYLGITGRVDNTTTLPKGNNTFFYPSVYMSAVLSDIFELPSSINFLKLRTAYAKVGGDLGNDLNYNLTGQELIDNRSSGSDKIYSARNSYITGGRYRNLPLASYPNILDNPNLSPSFNTSYEYGLEGKFFKNRFGFDFSYFENNYGPGIFTQRFSQTSGYEGVILNGKTTQRRGIDFTVDITPIRSENFTWNTTVNYSRFKETLTSLPNLPDGTPQTQDGRVKLGDRVDQFWMTSWETSPDGQLVIKTSGLPKTADVDLFRGYQYPDYTASVFNSLNYKNLNLSFLFDGRFGGTTFDRYERDLWRSGSHPESLHPERELSNIAYASGSDPRTMLIPGVVVESGAIQYDPQGNIISDTRTFVPNTYMTDYQGWASSYKGQAANNLLDKTFIKLREVTLTYGVPGSWIDKSFLKSASISLVARNIWYWSKQKTFADLDTYSYEEEADLQFPSQRTYGFNVNLQF